MIQQELNTIIIRKNSQYEESFIIVDENNEPVDLSVYTLILMDIRKNNNSNSELLYTASLVNNNILIENNVLTILIDADITKDWFSGIYYRDIIFIESNGKRIIPIYGKINVVENITKIN